MTIKYAVISNKDKDQNKKVSSSISAQLRKTSSCDVLQISLGKDEKIDLAKLKDVSIIFSLGGDGTFLNIARQTATLSIPIIGINLGSLGFLSEIELKDLTSSIEKIAADNYEITTRMMIECQIIRNNKIIYKDNALNDFVISRGELSRIITLDLRIDNSFVDSFPGDGLIISTPTGSTGYALSAGGPVIEHDSKLMLITPICSHVLHSRSFVIPKRAIISIKIKNDENSRCLLSIDGQKTFTLQGDDEIKIKMSKMQAKLIKVNDHSFYDTLRKKMYNRER